jgi:hypothetical protein
MRLGNLDLVQNELEIASDVGNHGTLPGAATSRAKTDCSMGRCLRLFEKSETAQRPPMFKTWVDNLSD